MDQNNALAKQPDTLYRWRFTYPSGASEYFEVLFTSRVAAFRSATKILEEGNEVFNNVCSIVVQEVSEERHAEVFRTSPIVGEF